MAAMTKRVNINAPVAIRNITPPIYGVCKNVIMSTGDILKCLCKRAIVDEILPDGSTVRLNMRNYYTDNGAGLDAFVIDVAENKPADQSIAHDEKSTATVVDTDTTNIPGVVNETKDEDNITSTEENNSNDDNIDESTIIEESTSDADSQIEEGINETSISSDDTSEEEPVTATTEEISTTDNVEEDKVEKTVTEDSSTTEIKTVENKKSEVAEKKPTTKSNSNTKKKSSNSSSKNKSASK